MQRPAGRGQELAKVGDTQFKGRYTVLRGIMDWCHIIHRWTSGGSNGVGGGGVGWKRWNPTLRISTEMEYGNVAFHIIMENDPT